MAENPRDNENHDITPVNRLLALLEDVNTRSQNKCVAKIRNIGRVPFQELQQLLNQTGINNINVLEENFLGVRCDMEGDDIVITPYYKFLTTQKLISLWLRKVKAQVLGGSIYTKVELFEIVIVTPQDQRNLKHCSSILCKFLQHLKVGQQVSLGGAPMYKKTSYELSLILHSAVMTFSISSTFSYVHITVRIKQPKPNGLINLQNALSNLEQSRKIFLKPMGAEHWFSFHSLLNATKNNETFSQIYELKGEVFQAIEDTANFESIIDRVALISSPDNDIADPQTDIKGNRGQYTVILGYEESDRNQMKTYLEERGRGNIISRHLNEQQTGEYEEEIPLNSLIVVVVTRAFLRNIDASFHFRKYYKFVIRFITFKPGLREDDAWRGFKENLSSRHTELYYISPDTPTEILSRIFDLSLYPSKFHCFLAHTWGPRHETHKQVKNIANTLRQMGFCPWLDEQRIKEGYVMSQIIAGIEESKVSLVCLTTSYNERLDFEDSYCYREFIEITNRARETQIVLMDEHLANPENWHQCFKKNRFHEKKYILMTDFWTDIVGLLRN